MIHRFLFRLSTLLALAACTVLAPATDAATRKALLVGIGHYQPKPKGRVPPFQPNDLRRKEVFGEPTRSTIPDLEGPAFDVESMHRLLVERYGFQENEIRILPETEATANGILKNLQDFLIEGSDRDDVRIFYFAGHGALIRNVATNDSDPTIVPYDSLAGAPDIRSKELRRWFAKFPDGVKFTYIADSCYSGGGTRGRNVYRSIDDDGRSVEDPAAGETLPPTPEQRGFLILSSSQANEQSLDIAVDETLPGGKTRTTHHGLFTWALVQVLMKTPGERIDRVIPQVRNLMAAYPQSQDARIQEPSGGGKDRLSKDLLGRDADPHPAADALVRQVRADRLVLSAGTVNNLFPGAKLFHSAGGVKSEVRISYSTLYESEAVPAEGSSIKGVSLNDAFKVSDWAAPPEGRIRLYAPPALDRSAILQTAQRLQSLVASGDGAPTHLIEWRAGRWRLKNPDGSGTPLGAAPSAGDVSAKLPRQGARLQVILPPTPELLAALKQQEAAFQLTANEADATYRLEGSLDPAGELQYWWALPVESNRKLTPYPPRTAAVTEQGGAKLVEYVLKLGKINSWLNFHSPNALDFPYHLQLVDVTDKNHEAVVEPGQELKENHLIRFDLQADNAEQERFAALKRDTYVYVFAVNVQGQSCLFYPDPESKDGDVAQRAPAEGDTSHFTLRRPAATTEIPAPKPGEIPNPCNKPDRQYDICVSAPYGTDTYFMMASARYIPNMAQAVEQEGVTKGDESAMEKMINNHGTSTRSPIVVPVGWKLESNSYRSVNQKGEQPLDNEKHPCR